MVEYISREAVLKCIENDGYEGEYDLGYYAHNREFQELIEEIPAADVVEVVRCKDCRFCMAFKDKSDGFYGHCRIWLTRVISDYAALVDADGYCSYGERKEVQG